MNTDKTRTHYETLAKQAAGEKVDVLALMQLAADMLDTGEFEVDRETGRQQATIPLVAELINASDRLQRKAIQQARLTSSVFTSEVESLRAALARIGGAP
ncbi:hypothetical protein FHW84_002517 [Dyella sp. SG562]|uniref:hypothetical protein n=1 Tax=Dyella sp. SG562 TaxID=2587017 RepID=UPI00141EBEC6|nr:hypothetical protein [Dyella sp. SG562]NII73944.1 hypothetical protein [Dyella sp. SG562]